MWFIWYYIVLYYLSAIIGRSSLRYHTPFIQAGGAEALRLAGTDGKTKRYDDEHGIVRKRTNIENVVLDREVAAHEIAEALPKEITTVPRVDLFIPEALKDAVFVGHVVTDLDSVGGAIGAAALYGGRAALASEVSNGW